jgi:hypothetical protein
MRTTRLRHAGALLTAAALLATMTAATVAGPVSAAKPKCAGKVATKVGTAKGEVIRGTRKNDVIVARGGNDRIFGRGGNDTICGGAGHDRILGGGGHDLLLGQTGRDRLYGQTGRDRLLGGQANDYLNGGTGNDACLQGTGSGPWLNCERPVPVTPVVPPPPEPPTLVIAYSDVNTNHVYDAGDIMIAKIIDTDKSTTISVGDTVKMGQYPTSPNVIKLAQLRSQFEPWKVKEHPVLELVFVDATTVHVRVGTDRWAFWRTNLLDDVFQDWDLAYHSYFQDVLAPAGTDYVFTQASPSQPTSPDLVFTLPGKGDDGFIDVEIYP